LTPTISGCASVVMKARYEAVVGEGPLELGHDVVVLRRRGVDGHQVVVVEVDAVGADLTQQADDLDRAQHRPYRLAERIASRVSNGPEAERELVLRFRRVQIAHG